jgi:hypothetical protein
MNKQLADLLVRARERITDPAHWTQGVSARDKNGVDTIPDFSAAVCWCAIGALSAETARTNLPWREQRDLKTTARGLVDAVSSEVFNYATVIYVNDAYRGKRNELEAHAATLMVFDLAIAKALS